MESGDGDNVVKMDIEGEGKGEEGTDAPLLVAMQPGPDMPPDPVEVVVVTAEDAQQLMQGGEIQTIMDRDTGQVVTVAAVEEVQGEGGGAVEQYTEADMHQMPPGVLRINLSDNLVEHGVVAQARPPGNSDSSDDLDSSSSEEEAPPKPKKEPKKREYARR